MKDYSTEVIPAVTTVKMTSKPERVLGETALIQTDGSALLKAAWLGRLRLMRLLIEGGTDVNKTNDEGRTALMVACLSKYKDTQSTTKAKIVKFLLENKCDPNLQDRHGRTALMYACLENTGTEVVSVLLNNNSDVRIVDKKGSSALVYAVNAGDTGVLRQLVDACKAQGKEVIIITTNKGLGSSKPETKQYLDVPPTLAQSPPYGKCVTPSDIYFGRVSPTTLQEPREATRPISIISTRPQNCSQDDNETLEDSSTDLRVPEHALLFEGQDTKRNVSPVLQSPKHFQSEKQATSTSALYTRRLHRRGNSTSPTDDSSFLSSRHDKYVSRGSNPSVASIQSLGDLHLQFQDLRDRTPSPPHQPPPRRPLLRRQSAEAFSTITLHPEPGSPKSAKQQLAASNSNPLHEHCEIPPNILPTSAILANRRRSLPGMPSPLRKSQTVHSICIPPELSNLQPPLSFTSSSQKLYGSHASLPEETEHLDEEVGNTTANNSFDSEEGPGGKPPTGDMFQPAREGPPGLRAKLNRQRFAQRRGSAPFVLDDELSHTRPGRLPPLTMKPSVPLPQIGCIRDPAIRSGPSSPSKTGRLDRRHSMQPEDLRSLTSFASRSRGNLRNHQSHSSESAESN